MKWCLVAFGIVCGMASLAGEGNARILSTHKAISIEFLSGQGFVEVRDNYSNKTTDNVLGLMVETSAPVRVKISSGVFTVTPGQHFSVGFTDRPPQFLVADTDGVLFVDLEKTKNYCGLVVRPYDGKDFLVGVEWRGQADSGPKLTMEWGHEGGDAVTAAAVTGKVGAVTRDPSFTRGGSPSFKLEKVLRDGEVNWTSDPVAVAAGKEYLFSGWYHVDRAAFGAVALFKVILRGEDQKDTSLQQYFLNPLIAPLNGEKWRYAQLRFSVPEKYDSLSASIALHGAAQSIWWDGLSIHEAPGVTANMAKEFTEEERAAPLDIEKVRGIWKERKPPEVAVENGKGFPALVVDGKRISSLVYNAYVVYPEQNETKQLLGTGVKWHYVPITPYFREWWQGKDVYDLSDLQSNIEKTLWYDPEAVIMLNVPITPWFREWGELYPDAVWRDHDGKKVAGHKERVHKPETLGTGPDDKWANSYTAREYRESVAEALRAFIRQLKSFDCGKAVAGICLWSGTDNQWFPHVNYKGFDYSPGAVRDFREYLKKLYGNDVRELKAAWHDSEVTFESAELAPFESRTTGHFFLNPNDGADRRVIDSNRYGDVGVMNTINYFGQVIKEEMGRNIFTIVYAPDIMQGYSGRSAREVLLNGKGIDGIVSVPEYGMWRQPGRTGHCASATASLALHNKIFLSELDYRTHMSWNAPDAYHYFSMAHGGALDPVEFANQARRDVGALAAQGEGAWFLAMNRTSFNAPEYLAAIMELASAMTDAAERPMPEDRGQIGVFADEYTRVYTDYTNFSQSLNNLSIGLAKIPLCRSGLSWDPYYLSDLQHPQRTRYKINLFLAAPSISAEQIEWVERNLQRDGNVLVFVNAAGMCSDKGSFEENIRRLTGMSVKYDPKTTGVFRVSPMPGSKDRIAQGLKDNVMTEMLQPLVYVDDPEATAFGEICGTGKVGWAIKRFKEWTSVYIAVPGALTPELLRNIAAEAGIQPIGPCDDVTSAGNGFITIHALSDGMKEVRWQGKCDVRDLITGTQAAVNEDQLSFEMKAGETRWFRKQAAR